MVVPAIGLCTAILKIGRSAMKMPVSPIGNFRGTLQHSTDLEIKKKLKLEIKLFFKKVNLENYRSHNIFSTKYSKTCLKMLK